MAFRFIIVDDDNCQFLGTNNEVLAREWAEDALVYDTQTCKSFNNGPYGVHDTDVDEVTEGPDALSEED